MLIGVDVVEITCWKCKCCYVLPIELYRAAKRTPHINFYCPYGHQAHYPEGETDEQKLRRERDRLLQRLAQKDDEITSLEHRRRAAVGQVTKLRNRVGNGVCPCCTRSFTNLRQHMETQHPEWRAEAAE